MPWKGISGGGKLASYERKRDRKKAPEGPRKGNTRISGGKGYSGRDRSNEICPIPISIRWEKRGRGMQVVPSGSPKSGERGEIKKNGLFIVL